MLNKQISKHNAARQVAVGIQTQVYLAPYSSLCPGLHLFFHLFNHKIQQIYLFVIFPEFYATSDKCY